MKLADLELNGVRRYKPFEGTTIEAMPELITSGRTPMSVSDLMRKRLEIVDAPKMVKDSWKHITCTGDSVVYNTNGGLMIVTNAEPLRMVGQERERLDNGLRITPAEYTSLDGIELTADEVKQYAFAAHKGLTRERAKSNIIWQALAGDEGLLNKYVDLVFDNFERSGGKGAPMGIFAELTDYIPVHLPRPY